MLPASVTAQSRTARCDIAPVADGIIFDLEDSVAEGQKHLARAKLLSALNDLDFGLKTVAVRINGIESPHMYKDVIGLAVLAIAERGADAGWSLVVPRGFDQEPGEHDGCRSW